MKVTFRAASEAPVTTLSGADMLDTIRAESSALGVARRWVLQSRIESLLQLRPATSEQIEAAIDDLVSWGDLIEGPEGKVAPAPLRAISTSRGHLILAGLPTRALREFMPSLEDSLYGRRCAAPAEVKRAVAAVSGLLLSVERWAGLERSPPLDGWLPALKNRLEGGRDDRFRSITWAEAQRYVGGGKWSGKAGEEVPMLYRARQMGRWWRYGWGLKPGVLPFEVLSKDEAARTCFAVDAAVGDRRAMEVEIKGPQVRIRFPARLPSAEYRLLVAEGAEQVESEGFRVRSDIWENLKPTLKERLGLT